MEEVKISKKSKVGILPFVAEFEEFAALAESIFKNAERRGDLDKAYLKLITAVFFNGKVCCCGQPSLFKNHCLTKVSFLLIWRAGYIVLPEININDIP